MKNKNKDYLVCIDSDGCVINTMNIKHEKCFGPCIIEVWNLYEYEELILSRWNDINLYSNTRGINRFKGIGMILKEIDTSYKKIEDLDSYLNWLNGNEQLSNEDLMNYIENNSDECSKNVLKWSDMVNNKVASLDPSMKVSFEKCAEVIKKIKTYADVVVLSAANKAAIEKEWEHNNLLHLVDDIYSQDIGTKDFCINELLKLGYDKNKVLKMGDAPGDLAAAKKNGVYFYPILFDTPNESWIEFDEIGLNKFISDDYQLYGIKKEEEFNNQFIGKN
ncbi:MAG: HAD family hydrolase [bacterium]